MTKLTTAQIVELSDFLTKTSNFNLLNYLLIVNSRGKIDTLFEIVGKKDTLCDFINGKLKNKTR